MDQHVDARKNAIVSKSSSDLELFDKIDESTKEVALNDEEVVESLEASCATNHTLNSMTGSGNNFQENSKKDFQ